MLWPQPRRRAKLQVLYSMVSLTEVSATVPLDFSGINVTRDFGLRHGRPVAEVAELADAQASGACGLRLVGVQIPPSAPLISQGLIHGPFSISNREIANQ